MAFHNASACVHRLASRMGTEHHLLAARYAAGR